MSNDSRKLLVVEDDPGLQTQLKWCFEGYDVVIAGDRETALSELEKHRIPVVTLDLGLPPDADGTSEGFQTLESILSKSPAAKVIVVTGNNDRQHALQAIGMGAYDFFYKPIDAELLGFIVNRAYRLYEIEDENQRLHVSGGESPLEGVITASPQMLTVCRTVEKVAPADATVLVLGESGTGKELLARAVHSLSGRSAGRFVAINCAAIPRELLENELFGHVSGAYTDARHNQPGLVEQARDGALFLDEVDTLPPKAQTALLRFIESRCYRPLGAREERHADTRIIAATNADLEEKVASGEFRLDLFYRLNVIPLEVPPLRERREDIPMLAQYFLDVMNQERGTKIDSISDEAMERLCTYEWPGNVRELENIIERAMVMANGSTIGREDLPSYLQPQEETVEYFTDDENLSIKEASRKLEKVLIRKALEKTDGNRTQAAKILEISHPALLYKMKAYGLD